MKEEGGGGLKAAKRRIAGGRQREKGKSSDDECVGKFEKETFALPLALLCFATKENQNMFFLASAAQTNTHAGAWPTVPYCYATQWIILKPSMFATILSQEPGQIRRQIKILK